MSVNVDFGKNGNICFRLRFGLVNSINDYIRLKLVYCTRCLQPLIYIDLSCHSRTEFFRFIFVKIFKTSIKTSLRHKKNIGLHVLNSHNLVKELVIIGGNKASTLLFFHYNLWNELASKQLFSMKKELVVMVVIIERSVSDL